MRSEGDIAAQIDEIKSSLAGQLTQEIQKIEQLRAEREKRQQEAALESARAAQAKLDAMLELQVHEAEERAKRRKFWTKFVLGPTGALSVIVGAVVAYVQSTKPEPTPAEKERAKVQAGDVVEKVKQVDREVELRFQRLESNDRAMARELVRQRVQISDGFQYVSDKIDAVHPRQAGTVDKPESLRDLKVDSEAVKASPTGRRILEQRALDDPLVELAGR